MRAENVGVCGEGGREQLLEQSLSQLTHSTHTPARRDKVKMENVKKKAGR